MHVVSVTTGPPHGRAGSTPIPAPAPPRRGTCAVLLQPPDLGVQALERAGVLPLQEQEVLLRAVQLVFQVCGGHAGIQVACKETRHLVLSPAARSQGGRGHCPPAALVGSAGPWAAALGSLAPSPGLSAGLQLPKDFSDQVRANSPHGKLGAWGPGEHVLHWCPELARGGSWRKTGVGPRGKP